MSRQIETTAAQNRGLAAATVIDLHAHAVLDETMGKAGAAGPELGQDGDMPWFRVGPYRLDGVRYRGSAFMDVNIRLERMKAAGIDFQVLSPNPLTYFHFIDAADAVQYCREHNDALAKLTSAHAERLAGLAALPMQDPAAAAEELVRAVGTLGLRGACIGVDMPHALDAAALDPVYETFTTLDVPLVVHPAPPGIDGPAGNPHMQRFDFEILFGFAGQETLAIATMIIGGVLDRHPALDVCFSHGGGAIAYLAGRIADATRRRPWSPDFLHGDGDFEARLARIWVDNHVHDPRALEFLEMVLGRDRLVLGTNFAGWDQPASLHVAGQDSFLAENARRLMRFSG